MIKRKFDKTGMKRLKKGEKRSLKRRKKGVCRDRNRGTERELKIREESRIEAERISIFFTRDVIKVAVVMLAVTMATEDGGWCGPY